MKNLRPKAPPKHNGSGHRTENIDRNDGAIDERMRIKTAVAFFPLVNVLRFV